MNEDQTTRDDADDEQVVSADDADGAKVVASGEASDPAPSDAEGAPEDPAATLSTLTAQLAEREDALLRLKAELDNLRKRATRDVENAHKYALDRFVSELLPVKDSLELGISACDADNADVSTVREGAELTHKMLSTAVEKFGVQEIDPLGQPFNPEFHQAVSMQSADGVDAGKVVTVIQKGYLLNERLVRPAMVIVSQ